MLQIILLHKVGMIHCMDIPANGGRVLVCVGKLAGHREEWLL